MQNITLEQFVSLLKSQGVSEISFSIKFGETKEAEIPADPSKPEIKQIPQEMLLGEL